MKKRKGWLNEGDGDEPVLKGRIEGMKLLKQNLMPGATEGTQTAFQTYMFWIVSLFQTKTQK